MKNALLALAAVMTIARTALATELTLFDIELQTVTPASLHRAAVDAGAKLQRESDGHRVYDARKLGVPGALSLETLFDGERFVVAAYSFGWQPDAEYELRRLLVEKYGPAHFMHQGKRHEIKLDERHAEAHGATWNFDAAMELVYNSGLPVWTPARLTYVNRPLFEALERREKQAQKTADQTKAQQLEKAF